MLHLLMELNPERERQRRYEKTNREKERERKRRWRASLATPSPSHGKTRLEVFDALQTQGNKCGICARPLLGSRAHGDHDHKTGKFRGVLCRGCNTGLGQFREKIKSLRAAIYYLEAHARRQEQLQALF